MLELLAHLIGDYVVQSDWMATRKTSHWWPALCHAACYTAVFLVLFGPRWPALAAIGVSHFVIDRWRLARFVVAAKNRLLSPPAVPAAAVDWTTGYPQGTPPWMAVWLLIIVDNTMHLCINHAALHYLR